MNETTATETRRPCTCRCGSYTNIPESAYLPGHDARHAGNVARGLVQTVTAEQYDALINQLPSVALRAKARDIAASLSLKAQAKADRKAARAARKMTLVQEIEASINGTVKVGRWEYPAQQAPDGSVTRNEKRDMSGGWVPAEAADFIAD